MRSCRVTITAWPVFFFAIINTAVYAQDLKATYPVMAPLEQYLSPDRQVETRLARSAAPPSISDHATVLVLGQRGYEKIIEGENGFTCLVERSWMSPFDSADFWNPKIRGPVCYNPAATRSILPYTVRITELASSHLQKDQINQRIRIAVERKQLPLPETGAMSYMLSKEGYLGDGVGHWHPHLMFHLPKTEAASWGANLPGTPVQFDVDHHDVPEPETIFFVVVAHWSDGSAASVDHSP